MNLIEYKRKIQEIKEYAVQNNISENQTNKLFKKCFYQLKTQKATKITITLKLLKFCCLISLIIVTCIFIIYNHPKTHNILLRNLQNFIYPGLKIFRKLAVPIITVYPSLTVWYDEWCLVENSYFQVNEMDCWPCSSINSVQDLTGYNITNMFNTGVPFIRTEKIEKIDVNKLFQTYLKYKDVNSNAEKIIPNDKLYRRIPDIMYKKLDRPNRFFNGNAHIKWRINQMEISRKLRNLFPKLPGVPNWWGPSTEKFVFIDEPKSASYKMPNTECANVVILCTNGERLIELNPSPECIKNCQKQSIVLTAHQSLWYNWWYWRPTSLPSSNATTISIMYLTSYC